MPPSRACTAFTASGAAVAVGIAAIVVPGVVDGKPDRETEEDQR